jgi:NodT family efflux transporter outer membrane factor (OMF) lipoprotein
MYIPYSASRWHTNLRLPVLGTAIAVALSACAVGPTYRGPPPTDAPPAAFVGAAAGVTTSSPQDAWWLAFNDPVLTGLVEAALRDNPLLATAEARVRRSREGIVMARAGGLPAANATARVSDDKLSRNGENLALIPFSPARTEFTDYRLALDASWEIDLAGRTRREVEAAVARFGSAEETRNDARVVIAAEVATAYVEFRGATRRLEIASERDSQAEQALRLVKLQRDAGIIGDTEYLQTVVERRSAAAAAATAAGTVDPVLFSLVALTGEPVEALRSRLGAPAPLPVPPHAVPIGLPADLLRRRPDVRRAERELAGATAEVGAAVAAQFPRLSLVGIAGLDSIRAGDLTSAASRYWTIAPQLTLPLIASGRLRSGVRAAQADLGAAVATYRGTVLRAVADTESSIVRYGASLQRLEAFGAAAAARESNLVAIRRRHDVGDASMLEVLSAERAADDAREQLTAESVELAAGYIALSKALGGGWQQP